MTIFTNSVINLFTPLGAVRFLEFIVFLIMVIYSFLAFILVRQVSLMNRSFKTPYAPVYKLAALVHFFAACFLTLIMYFVI